MVSWDFFIQMRTTMAGHVGVGDFGDGAVGVGDDGDADHRIFHIFSTSHFTISPRHISYIFHDFPTSHFKPISRFPHVTFQTLPTLTTRTSTGGSPYPRGASGSFPPNHFS